MKRIACSLILLFCSILNTHSQHVPGFTNIIVTPATNVILVSESTNLFTVKLPGYSVTNEVVETDDQGNTVTNRISVLLYSNVLVTVSFTLMQSNYNVSLFDGGFPPDKQKDDGVFSGNVIIPEIREWTYQQFRILIAGIDLTITNATGDVVPTSFTNVFVNNYVIVPRPENDKFKNALKVSPGTFLITATNNYASIEPGEPRHAKVSSVDASVWWMWTSPVTTNVLIDLAGTSFNSVLAVYTGVSVTQLVEIASAKSDTASGKAPYVNFAAQSGVTYKIAVSGLTSNDVGNIRLRIIPGGTLDTRAPLVSIISPDRETITTTNILTIVGTAKEPLPTDSGVSNVTIRVNNGPEIYLLSDNYESWSMTLFIQPGTNLIQAYAVDYAGNQGKADFIVVRYLDPINDYFANAQILSGVAGIAYANTERATVEPYEPYHAGNSGGRSVWYKWTSPGSGTLQLTTEGSNFDTILAVYVSTNQLTPLLTDLVEVVSNDDADSTVKTSSVLFNVTTNTTYYIAVDGYGGSYGFLQLQYVYVPPEAGQYYTLVVSNTAGGSVTPAYGTYKAGARVTITATPDKYFEFVSWSGSINSGNNPLTFTINQDVTLLATFRLAIRGGDTNMTDDFETGDLKKLAWSTQSPQWFVQTNIKSSGLFSARAGKITDNQVTTLTLITNTSEGTGAFDLYVSSEENWDYLEFLINGKLVARWSGEVGWTNFMFSVPGGTNKFEWRYSKDASFSGGLDTACIDNLFLPIKVATVQVVAPTIKINWVKTGQAIITLNGQPGMNYLLEASSDLLLWLPLDTKSSESGIIQFNDNNARYYPCRFYRVSIR